MSCTLAGICTKNRPRAFLGPLFLESPKTLKIQVFPGLAWRPRSWPELNYPRLLGPRTWPGNPDLARPAKNDQKMTIFDLLKIGQSLILSLTGPKNGSQLWPSEKVLNLTKVPVKSSKKWKTLFLPKKCKNAKTSHFAPRARKKGLTTCSFWPPVADPPQKMRKMPRPQ